MFLYCLNLEKSSQVQKIFVSLALANLFIVISRASYTGEEKETLIKNFKKHLGKDSCQNIFNLLIDSLNSEYYKENYSFKNPVSTNDWLDIFHSTQYMHNISDPLIKCIQLVRSERSRKVDFELIENMKPLLRAVLVGQYGFDLDISKGKLKLFYEIFEELTFLSACLINDSAPEKTPPNWLTEALIKNFLEIHWNTIGKEIFVHAFGLSYRNKNRNKLYEKLEDLIHSILLKKLLADETMTKEWINKLEFPNDFIAFFGWLSSKKIVHSKIPDNNIATILNQFINELQRISKASPTYLAAENSNDPFRSYQLHEGKYQNTIANLLLFLLYATETNHKQLKNICLEFKPFFYGGYKACSLATHFTELMLLIGLSGFHLNGLEENEFKAIKKYLELISGTVLIPYVHLTEREDEIWNPESEKEVFQFSAGRHIITKALVEIQKHQIGEHYQDFFEKINETTVANWNFEDIK